MSVDAAGKKETHAQIEAALEKSQGTDIIVLLQAKEAAKRVLTERPNDPETLRMFERASKMLADAQKNTAEPSSATQLKDVGEVLEYLQEIGRKIGKSKLYQDIRDGRLRRDKDLTFALASVDKYASTLPMSETPADMARQVEDRMRRKDVAEIRIKEADARRKELAADVAEGKYIPRDVVEQELAARAIAFNFGLKSFFESQALDLIDSVSGDTGKAAELMRQIESIIDDMSNRYAAPITFEIELAEEVENAEG